MLAAIGGMAVPVAIYLAFNAGEDSAIRLKLPARARAEPPTPKVDDSARDV